MNKSINFLFVFLLSIAFCLPVKAQFNFTGDATMNGADCFSMTQGLFHQDGAIWSTTQVDLDVPFSLTLNVDMGDIGALDADGIAFVLQTVAAIPPSDPAPICGGGCLNYVNMGPNSLAVAFRTYVHDRIEIWNNTPSPVAGSPTAVLPPLSGNHPIVVSWDPGTTTLTVDYNADGVDITWVNDIKNNFFAGTNLVYWGLTGTTGALTANTELCDVSLINAFVPTMSEWGLIILALLLLNISIVFAGQKKLITNVGSISSLSFPFEKSSFVKHCLLVSIAVLGMFVIANGIFGYEYTSADPIGMLMAIPLIAFLIQQLKN